jgi:hypothetical protein
MRREYKRKKRFLYQQKVDIACIHESATYVFQLEDTHVIGKIETTDQKGELLH